MKILVAAAGSYGDIAPYTGLGAGLQEAGHEVALAADASFAPLVEAAGLTLRPLPADPYRGQGGGSMLRTAAGFVRELGTGLAGAVPQDTGLLLLSTTTAPLGVELAEALGIPALGVYLQPVEPTGEFAPAVGGARSLGRWGNRAAGLFSQRVVDRLYRDAVRALRAELGLPRAGAGALHRRRKADPLPVLHGFSTALVPRPADWRPGLEVVGNWWPRVPPGAQLPGRLAEFLAAGPPPVFVGFGSMGYGEGERLGALAVRALRRAGVRGVLQSGRAGLSAGDCGAGDDMLTVGEVPHELLFPQLAAVVHHAGAGTAAAALRAGVPSVPVPVTADQPFWASRLAAAGAATAPLPFPALTGDPEGTRLTEAVRTAVRDASLGRAARRGAALMAAEDGVGAVLRAVEAAGG
ncbi:glycosyltransferase [Streptomyces sp. NBC_00466]|uniref:glycosyltransferase n=1 Tax=Streptomyces sp. NBC_00466 TaxID=2903655 RepID=UPI0030E33004